MAAGGLRVRIARGKQVETCPVKAFRDWRAVAKRKAGPLFRRISTAGRIGEAALHPDAVRQILAHRIRLAGIEIEGSERLSAHALRVGFITEAYGKGGTKTSCGKPAIATCARCGATSSVPARILELGPTHPEALTWLREHWGTERLRQVHQLGWIVPAETVTRGFEAQPCSANNGDGSSDVVQVAA